MARKHIKSMNERLVMDSPGTKEKPGISRPGTQQPPQQIPRPGRPIPIKRPGEKEKGKPMAGYKEMIDLFFDDLQKIKDTTEGKLMIKNLHNRYAKKQSKRL